MLLLAVLATIKDHLTLGALLKGSGWTAALETVAATLIAQRKGNDTTVDSIGDSSNSRQEKGRGCELHHHVGIVHQISTAQSHRLGEDVVDNRFRIFLGNLSGRLHDNLVVDEGGTAADDRAMCLRST